MEVISNDWFYDKVNGRIRVRPYALVNPKRTNKHDKHLHVTSVGGALGDDARAWTLNGAPAPVRPTPAPVRPTIKKGSSGQAVWDLQRKLTTTYELYSKWTPTGFFGDQTDASVREFQKRSQLKVDGVVGPVTWRALGF